MKAFRYPIVIIVILFLSNTLYAEKNSHDGNWWDSLTISAKQGYCTGFIEGMDVGYHLTYWKSNDTHEIKTTTSAAEESFCYHKNQHLSNTSVNEISERITSFYKDFRNRKIFVRNAIRIVFQGISGTSEEEMKKIIENWRRNETP